MKTALLKKGYSVRAVEMMFRAHKDSTSRQYQAVWKKFLDFLKEKSIPDQGVSIPVVCDFLTHQTVDLERKYRTVSGYRSALRLPLKFACGLEVMCMETDTWLRGAFQYNPPIRAKEMPLWNLNCLLGYLNSSTFEPLETAPYFRIFKKGSKPDFNCYRSENWGK